MKVILFVIALLSWPACGCPYLKQQQTEEGQGLAATTTDLPSHASGQQQSRRLAPHPLPDGHRSLQESSGLFDVFIEFYNFIRSIFPFLPDIFNSDEDSDDGGGGGGGTVTNAQEAVAAAKADILGILNNRRRAQFVRLSFHDCVGGACDGCVDMANLDNRGLQDPIDDLEDIVTEYAAFLTRGDVWALAGLTAAEDAQQGGGALNNCFNLNMVGRPSCDDPTGGPDRDLPSAHLTTSGLVDFFSTNFGFSERETTAIMGAHTLGRAQSENSGFDGEDGWVPNQNRLDNQFYRVLLNNGNAANNLEPELQINTNREEFPNQFLWRERGDDEFMLNADMALVANMDGYVDSTTGAITCNVAGSTGNADDCPDSTLLVHAADYEDNNGRWIQDFCDVFVKMTHIGCDDCQAL